MQGVTEPSERAFRRHYADVYRYVRRRTRDEHQAEELTQQVFADAAASLRCDGRPPIAWLYAVAKRRFADAARRDSRRRAAQVDLRAEPAVVYAPPPASGPLAAVARLARPQRGVFRRQLLP